MAPPGTKGAAVHARATRRLAHDRWTLSGRRANLSTRFHKKTKIDLSIERCWVPMNISMNDLMLTIGGTALIIGICGGLAWLVYAIIQSFIETCPACGQKGGVKLLNEQVLRQEHGQSVRTFYDEKRDASGKVISTTSRQVPVQVLRSLVEKEKKCIKCGHSYKTREWQESANF